MTRHAPRGTESAEALSHRQQLGDGFLQDFRADGYAVLSQKIAGEPLEALRTEADALTRRFTQDGFRSDDYWHFTPTGTDAPVLYRIHTWRTRAPRRRHTSTPTTARCTRWPSRSSADPYAPLPAP